MKKLTFVLLALLFTNAVFAQEDGNAEIKSTGNFVYISQQCLVNNNSDEIILVDRVLLKKELITSLVVQADAFPKQKTSRKLPSKPGNSVIVTTSEKVNFTERTYGGVAMNRADKTYEFIFENGESADSFADRLIKAIRFD